MKRVYVLVFDGYADWELGNVLAEVRRLGKAEVVSVGFTEDIVVSMGGLRVIPDMSLARVEPGDISLFILPGGYLWEKGYPRDELEPFLKSLEASGTPIAAICAATTVLARAGILKGRAHTSNSPVYLEKMASGHTDPKLYVDALAVRDRQVITASGLGAVDFTVQVLEELALSTPETRQIWYDAFKKGEYPDDFDHEG